MKGCWDRKGIEKREGSLGMLLIAPHGFPGDDDNTGSLTREMARMLGCYAVINEVYQKPEKRIEKEQGRMTEVPDIAQKRINLHRCSQVEQYAREEFLEPILECTHGMIKKQGSALVLWIHGIKDCNITEDVVEGSPRDIHVVLGIGQGNGQGLTARKETVDRLITCLEKNGVRRINAALAKKDSIYSGSHPNIMNQFFRKRGYPLSSVQSVQLEIKYSGFRDPESIETAAAAFSQALLQLLDTYPSAPWNNPLNAGA